MLGCRGFLPTAVFGIGRLRRQHSMPCCHCSRSDQIVALGVGAGQRMAEVAAAEVAAAEVLLQLLRVEVLLLRQVVAAKVGCGAEVRCGSAEVVAAVLLSNCRTGSCAMRRTRSPD